MLTKLSAARLSMYSPLSRPRILHLIPTSVCGGLVIPTPILSTLLHMVGKRHDTVRLMTGTTTLVPLILLHGTLTVWKVLLCVPLKHPTQPLRYMIFTPLALQQPICIRVAHLKGHPTPPLFDEGVAPRPGEARAENVNRQEYPAHDVRSHTDK